MKIIFFIFCVLVVLDGTRSAFIFWVHKDVVSRARSFSVYGSQQKTLLVLGDSTAVGVGATAPEDTIAGRFANDEKFTWVENYAVSGARSSDLAEQLSKRTLEKYDAVLVQVGANDVIRFSSPFASVKILHPVFSDIKKLSDDVTWIMAGNIGGAPFFPYAVRPIYQRLSLAYHKAFAELARDVGFVYIDLYAPPHEDIFLTDTKRYFAPDLLHPSSEGYRIWYEKIKVQRHGI